MFHWWNKSNETSQNNFTIIIILPLFCFLCFIFSIRRQNKRIHPLPPGPRGLPLLGYLPFLDSNFHHTFINLATLYGPIFKVQLGMKHFILISSPSLVKEVVKDQDIIFANRGDPTIAVTSFMLGTVDILFSNYGHDWRKMRKIFVSRLMSHASINESSYLRKWHVKKMIYDAYNKANLVVNVGDLAFVTVISSIMSLIWGDTLKGVDVNADVINAEFRSLITELIENLGTPNVSDLFPLLAWFDLQGIERKVKMISSRCEAIFDSAINHHNNKKQDFLGHLLQLTEFEDPATSLTLHQVKAILMDTVIGATDTTTAVVEWSMAEVLNNAQVMNKVQEELTKIVGLDSRVEEVHLSKLNYLNAVVKESLRLHPPIPLLVHSPSEPTTIGGYTIPKGVKVFLNVYSIQRDPHVWEDPLLFKPERFISESAAEKMDYSGKHFQYLPFGSGRRMCAGIALAERTVMLVLASLLHSFQWKLPDGSIEVDTSEKFGMVAKKAKPLLAVPTPRLSRLELYSLEDY